MPQQIQADPKLKMEKLHEITIQLDTYDDIFSDFDPRPYSERAVSQDLLKEISRRYMENKHGRFEVLFTIPASERDIEHEPLIKKRLREHFEFELKNENKIIAKTRRYGIMYAGIGALALLINTIVFFVLQENSVYYQLISILLVPVGWYGMFVGIEKIIDEPLQELEKKKLYEKFCKANYIFMTDDKE